MEVDLDRLNPTQKYFLMTQTVIPRPIAWVLTANGNGSHNLAPFSYFNAVCSDPPLVAISVGWKSEGTRKDTWTNIESRERFVIHIAGREMLSVLNESSIALPHGESEVQRLGLETVAFGGFDLPRLRLARVAFACRRYVIHELGPKRQALILGRIVSAYLDDGVVRRRGSGFEVLAAALDPIARLGGGEYAMLTDYTKLPRPK